MTQKFEPLFKPSSDYHNNACLNFMHDMSEGYIDGYKYAADELVNKIDKTGVDQDYLVYPIVFLYRQHLELLLKRIIKSGRKHLATQEQGYPTHHKLKDLWSLAKSLRKEIWNENHPSEFEIVDHVISEYTLYDPASMAFRYPENKKGGKPNEKLKHINTRHLFEFIEKASSILWGVELCINELEADAAAIPKRSN